MPTPSYNPAIALAGTTLVVDNTITFTPTEPLDPNYEYIVVLSKDIENTDGDSLGQDYIFSFQTELSPMYCSVDIIKDDIGVWIKDIPDALIARYIYRSSRFADNMAVDPPMYTDPATNVTSLTYEAEQFVRYDVDVNLIQLVYLGKVGTGGDSVVLGDFEVKKRSAFTPDLQSSYKDIRGQRQLFYDGIMGHHKRRYAAPSVASKGANVITFKPDRSLS